MHFLRVLGAEVLSQSEFELPRSRPASLDVASAAENGPAAELPVEPAAWTLWGQGTAGGFDDKPKDDFLMDGNVFTGYLGLDYCLHLHV